MHPGVTRLHGNSSRKQVPQVSKNTKLGYLLFGVWGQERLLFFETGIHMVHSGLKLLTLLSPSGSTGMSHHASLCVIGDGTQGSLHVVY